MNDSAIVDLYLARSEDAVKETSLKYGARLRAVALKLGCDPGTAEECENDVYLRAWELIPPNEPRAYLFAFLAKLLRSAAIDRLRKASAGKRSAEFTELTRELEECLAGSMSVETEAEAKELGRTINSFLASQPMEKRMLFIRRYWFFDSVEELSTRFGFSKSKVKTELFRMRERLADYLRKEGYSL